jgi:signal transduction histidine kinase/DNA-binding response OmpR family regulator/HPt (histidine-containing phosphotransfer) domain-containing protein
VTSVGDVWFVRATADGAVFVASHHVLRWNGRSFEAWPLKSVEHLTGFAGTGDRVWIYQPGIGLLRLDDAGPPVLAHAAAGLPPATISWVGEVTGGAEQQVLLVVTNEGVCRLDAHGCEELPDVSSIIRGNFPVTATLLDSDTLAIATVESGVVVANATTGELQQQLNAATGLATDNVHALWADTLGGLWVGLDSGFARVEAINAVSLYDHRLGMAQGVPQRVVEHAGRRYVLTDRELFIVAGRGSAAAETSPLLPLVQRQPLLHDAISAHGRLWLAGYGAVWVVNASGPARVVASQGDVDHLCAVEFPSGAVVFTEGRKLRLAGNSGDGWFVRDLGQEVDDTPVSVVCDAGGDVWVSTVLAGVYRYRHGATPDDPWLRVAHLAEGSGLPREATRPVLTKVAGRILAFSDAGMLRFEANERFELIPEFRDFTGVAAAVAGDAAYWLVRDRPLGESAPLTLVRVGLGESGELVAQPLRSPGLENLGAIEHFDVTELATHPVLWVTSGRGILRLNLQAMGAAPSVPEVLLRRILVADAPLATSAGPSIFGPALSRLEFRYGWPAATLGEPVYFQTRLAPVERAWSAPEKTPAREFTGLAQGWYSFQVRAVDRYGRAGPPTGFSFRVLAPWYLRPLAIGADAALAALVIFGFVRWRLRVLHRQTERLNQLVAERTRHLELVSTAKSEFLENISHEIRNPLNGIVGLSHMFNEERLGPQDRELARSLKASAEHLRRVSEEVLSFSALEYGQLSIEEKTFALAALVEGVADLYRVSARQRGNTLALHVAPEATRSVVGDANKIETIVGNFVSNAIKYAPATAIDLRVECETSAAGLQAVISVTDHGAGIPAPEQELIFQKFVRGTNAKAARVPGTGIGLAACRVLARALGGSVGVDSEPGEGATFHLWIPLKWAVTQPEARPLGGTALIVEDEEYNRVVLRGTTEALGYKTTAAGNSDDALALLEKTSFDVLLLDWELPGSMKGPDIARAVRARAGGERVVILAVTAHNSEEVRRRAREAGMDAFLLKPVDTAQVGAVIRDVLARRSEAIPDGVTMAELAPAAPAVTGENTLNLEVFRTFAQYAPEHAHDPAGHFIAAVDAEVAAIHRGAESQTWPTVVSAAHRLRALAALVRASRLNQAAGRLQELAKLAEHPDEIRRLVAETVAAAEEMKARITSAGAR